MHCSEPTVASIMHAEKRGQHQQQHQHAQPHIKQQQGASLLLDEGKSLASCSASSPAERNSGKSENSAGSDSIKYAAQAPLAQIKEKAEPSTEVPFQSVIGTTNRQQFVATGKQCLSEENAYSNNIYTLLNRSARARGGGSAASYQPTIQTMELHSPLPFFGMISVQPPINQHFIRSQLNSATSLSLSIVNQQPFSVSLPQRAFGEYCAVQDNGAFVPLRSVQASDRVAAPPAQYFHDMRLPNMLQQTPHQLQAFLLPEPRLANFQFQVPLDVPTHTTHSNPTFYSINANTPESAMTAARADRIAKLTDLLTAGQLIHPFHTKEKLSIMPIDACSNNIHEQGGILTSASDNNGNIAALTRSNESNNDSVRDELQPLPKVQALVATTKSDGDTKSIFSKTTAAVLVQEGYQIFPVVLHRALTELERVPQGPEIAAFSLDGKSFQIKSQHLFEQQVLPVFFPKMKLFGSFQRQLNLYNFQRSNRGCEDGSFYHHELFERGSSLKAYGMKRTKVKSRAGRYLTRR